MEGVLMECKSTEGGSFGSSEEEESQRPAFAEVASPQGSHVYVDMRLPPSGNARTSMPGNVKAGYECEPETCITVSTYDKTSLDDSTMSCHPSSDEMDNAAPSEKLARLTPEEQSVAHAGNNTSFTDSSHIHIDIGIGCHIATPSEESST